MAVTVLDGDEVRQELARLGVSQAQFAEFVRIEPADVSRALNRKPIAAEFVYRICLGLEQMKRGRR
jgi:adenylylsulfate kinase-like enzyme